MSEGKWLSSFVGDAFWCKVTGQNVKFPCQVQMSMINERCSSLIALLSSLGRVCITFQLTFMLVAVSFFPAYRDAYVLPLPHELCLNTLWMHWRFLRPRTFFFLSFFDCVQYGCDDNEFNFLFIKWHRFFSHLTSRSRFFFSASRQTFAWTSWALVV